MLDDVAGTTCAEPYHAERHRCTEDRVSSVMTADNEKSGYYSNMLFRGMLVWRFAAWVSELAESVSGKLLRSE